jgi:hypothetical protein
MWPAPSFPMLIPTTRDPFFGILSSRHSNRGDRARTLIEQSASQPADRPASAPLFSHRTTVTNAPQVYDTAASIHSNRPPSYTSHYEPVVDDPPRYRPSSAISYPPAYSSPTPIVPYPALRKNRAKDTGKRVWGFLLSSLRSTGDYLASYQEREILRVKEESRRNRLRTAERLANEYRREMRMREENIDLRRWEPFENS